ncbi:putative EG45-like domain containing protein 1 isoform X3 [Nymphaea colorata]|nr:putative EG45-like domain containing protein 1 isoform X3 [Nymphaea colorata]
MFAAASERIWDNGAACGRTYQVRCLSGEAPPNPCNSGENVKVTVVDQAPPVSTPSSSGTTLVLTVDAFFAIADSSASLINIEFLHYRFPSRVRETGSFSSTSEDSDQALHRWGCRLVQMIIVILVKGKSKSEWKSYTRN